MHLETFLIIKHGKHLCSIYSSGPFHIHPVSSHIFVFPSRDKEVNSLVGVQHLSCSLCSGDGSQFVSVVARVECRAGPAGLLPLSFCCQNVTHLAIEVWEGGQSIKYQVLDPFDCVPKRSMSEIRLF